MIINRIVPLSSIGNLNIYDVAEEKDASIRNTPPNKRFHYIIHFVVEGEGVYYTYNPHSTSEHKLSPNTLFAVYTDNIVQYRSNPDAPLHYYWVGFDGAESESILNYIGFSADNPTLNVFSSDKIIETFNELIQSWKNKDVYALFSSFYSCIQAMHQSNTTSFQQPLQKNDNEILLHAQQYIQSNLHNNIKVQDVVNHLHIDRSYFSKLFKQKLKIPPSLYLMQCRLSEAEQLLTTTNFSIKEIVNLLNFTNIYAFSRLFKNRFHCSPTQYRKQLKKN